MLQELNFYLLLLFHYSFYCLLSYRFLRQSKIDMVSKYFIKNWGLRFADNEELVIMYASKIEKWGIGTLFLNNTVFGISLLSIFYIIFKEYRNYGILGILIISIISFLLQILIGEVFKGYGIQRSTFIFMLVGLILLIKYTDIFLLL